MLRLIRLSVIIYIFLIGYLPGCTVAKSKKNRKNASKSDDEILSNEAKNVTITSWQFCEGCKLTIDVYAERITNEMKKMIKSGKPSGSELVANNVVDGLCESDNFAKYNDFVKWSCTKIFEEFRVPFLEAFQGTLSQFSTITKADIYDKRMEVCVNKVKACSAKVFKKEDTVKKSNKSKCAACKVIVSDLEMARRVRKGSIEEAVEDVCSRVGYNHQPYIWLETVCEEIIDEKLDDIVGATKFREKLLKGGFNPDQSYPDAVCDELYKCSSKKETEEL